MTNNNDCYTCKKISIQTITLSIIYKTFESGGCEVIIPICNGCYEIIIQWAEKTNRKIHEVNKNRKVVNFGSTLFISEEVVLDAIKVITTGKFE